MEMNDNQKNMDDSLETIKEPVADINNEAVLTNQGGNWEKNQASRQSYRYAGFWMRFWSYLLDLIVVGSIERLLVRPLFRWLDLPLAEFNLFAPISIASAIIFYLYFVLMTKYFNQTLGKMVFGLKVVALKNDTLSWGTILFREWIGRFISATVIVGYIIVAFLPKKQGLHDLFTDTTVVHVER